MAGDGTTYPGLEGLEATRCTLACILHRCTCGLDALGAAAGNRRVAQRVAVGHRRAEQPEAAAEAIERKEGRSALDVLDDVPVIRGGGDGA